MKTSKRSRNALMTSLFLPLELESLQTVRWRCALKCRAGARSRGCFESTPKAPTGLWPATQDIVKIQENSESLEKKIKNTDFLPSFSGLVIWTMKEVGPQVVTFRASNALNAQEGSVTVEVIRAPEIQLRILKFLFGMIWDWYLNSHAGGVWYCVRWRFVSVNTGQF